MLESPKTGCSEGKWIFFPHNLIRNTGIPFEILEGLGFTETTEILSKLSEAEHRVAELRNVLRNKCFRDSVDQERHRRSGKEISRAMLALRKKVNKSKGCQSVSIKTIEPFHPSLAQRLLCWNEAITFYDELLQKASAVFNIELSRKQAQLVRISGEERFQHAIFLLSPTMFQGTLRRYMASTPNPRNARVRMAEKKLVAYLQRFCSKNERGSFMGPVNYGEFDRNAKINLDFRSPSTMEPQKREVFMSFWSMEALANCIGQEASILPHLRPRHYPMADVINSQGSLFHSLSPSTPIRPELVEVWRKCDGVKTVRDIAKIFGLNFEKVTEILDQLVRLKMITCTLDLPPTVARPLEYLRLTVAELPLEVEARETWLTRLDEFERLRVGFRDGGLEQRVYALDQMEQLFEKLTSLPPQRGAGEFYSDRFLLFEECSGTLGKFVIGGKLLHTLEERLSKPFNLWAAIACIKWRKYQNIGLEVYKTLSPQGEPVPYMKFINRLSQLDKQGMLRPRIEKVDRDLREILEGYLTYDNSERRAELSPAALKEVRLQAAWGDEKHSLISSPDIFFLATDLETLRNGQFKVVMGDVHDDWTTIGAGACAYFHDRQQEMRALQDQMLLDLPDGDRIATILPRRRHKDYCAEPPGISIELSGKSIKPREQVVDFAHLRVVRMQDRQDRQDRLVLRHPSIDSWLCLCTGDVKNLAHWIFSWPRVVPLRLGEGMHTTRIEMNGVIIQRERWLLDRKAIDSVLRVRGVQLMVEMWRLKERLGLPNFGFALSDAEVKPIFIDFRNFFLLELFQELLSNATTTEFTEMLPGPDQLWLKDCKGKYCSEFRTGVVYLWNDT